MFFFQRINIRQASSYGFQHLPRDLANVNAWKYMFDPHTHAMLADALVDICTLFVQRKQVLTRRHLFRKKILQ